MIALSLDALWALFKIIKKNYKIKAWIKNNDFGFFSIGWIVNKYADDTRI